MTIDSLATESFPSELPVISLRELVVFPYMALPLIVARERSIAAVEDALEGDQMILLVAQRDSEVFDPQPEQLYDVGTVAVVTSRSTLSDGRLKVLIQGVAKARIVPGSTQGYRARVEEISVQEEAEWTVEGEALVRAVRSRVEQLLPLKSLPPEVLSVTSNIDNPGKLADMVASNLRLRVSEAQQVLETEDSLARLRRVDALVRRELEVTNIQAEIQTQAKEEMSRGEREVFLREQLRAIQSELGETDGGGNEADEYRSKIAGANLSHDSFEEANRQVQRLSTMHPDGPEAQVVRNYLDWLLCLPWDRCSPDRLDLVNAREILDADHAHLNKVKDRILEFLSVRKLRNDSRGPILCFAGAPGVGKTSLGRSIARSMGREFVRISLGGVRDEAEIRGHRRTYVGAMPGRIIQAMKKAGTSNPVIMLDEIDKLSSNDFRGDPAAALLEVLDPEQNHDFSDHFLSIPFDLSRVLFIATANRLETIPGPLRDRMETVQLSGYSQEEKVEIASRFLVPRQIDENGLNPEQMNWSAGAIEGLVSGYTREAGVRNLERQVAAVCRKVARKAAEGDGSKVSITRRSLTRYLGNGPYAREKEEQVDEVGVVRGLAWTEAGGELLPVESSLAAGKGMVLTGQLGDVMKESGLTALSFVRSTLRSLDSVVEDLSESEVHVHVPDGATPKDGPSAGVAIATAIFSAATGIPVRGDVAMTGEVTLRGKVLAVGGVREKALAALRAGVSEVILPRQCMTQVEAIPKELRRKLTFIPVNDMSEVLDAALAEPPVVRVKAVPSQRSEPSHLHASFKPGC
ncbi:MAG: endopeptidase La [Myxococcota bacterium]|jgi:ATP-dependent Lon protease|nr:endopeptidase La [Myxococcota bacterium]